MAVGFWPGLLAVGGMYLAFLVIGWLATKKNREGTVAELLVAGRSMPLWVATLTMTATWVDGGYLLGTAEGIYKYGLATGAQGGVCFGVSLLLGGLFFARKMRKHEFSTMIDPFEQRFGKGWAAVLVIPALLSELFWSGALLVALGSTLSTLLGWRIEVAILASAGVVTAYTIAGGMWSVAFTDAFQLALIPIGLLIALPFALFSVGGLEACWVEYAAQKGDASRILPPLSPGPAWTLADIVSWWDMAAMLMLGGIPWNCYFQRVLSCQSPGKAAWHSIFAGILTILLVIPPVLLGMAAFVRFGADGVVPASRALPQVLQQMTPTWVLFLGLAAIIGAVTSSYSASILSIGSMLGWNIYRPLIAPQADVRMLRAVIRASIGILGAIAALMALRVKSVGALWLFTGELVYALLFPQLVAALFDPKANLSGSVIAFLVSLTIRLGGGFSLETDDGMIGFASWLPGLSTVAELASGSDSGWQDSIGATRLPIRTIAALAGLIVLPIASRMTARWIPPTTLRESPA